MHACRTVLQVCPICEAAFEPRPGIGAIMLERQREGIAKAQREGKFRGRQPTARRRAAEVRGLVAAGIGKAETARRLGISEASVYRILAAARAA
jgi:DNA invertase Pin-like site-specific DNA recombinase